ncbi:MAG: hypothetical protein A2Y14_05490 [Verrucomicrobia bacterium GWF2_51_19]|nr:MAG: hypothetical protein A2Y14_05490 [Verrucomicrobia bacterium GWF2_51_19]HCJ12464.1 hypothetical protein [Opitutae bacterium]
MHILLDAESLIVHAYPFWQKFIEKLALANETTLFVPTLTDDQKSLLADWLRAHGLNSRVDTLLQEPDLESAKGDWVISFVPERVYKVPGKKSATSYDTHPQTLEDSLERTMQAYPDAVFTSLFPEELEMNGNSTRCFRALFAFTQHFIYLPTDDITVLSKSFESKKPCLLFDSRESYSIENFFNKNKHNIDEEHFWYGQYSTRLFDALRGNEAFDVIDMADLMDGKVTWEEAVARMVASSAIYNLSKNMTWAVEGALWAKRSEVPFSSFFWHPYSLFRNTLHGLDFSKNVFNTKDKLSIRERLKVLLESQHSSKNDFQLFDTKALLPRETLSIESLLACLRARETGDSLDIPEKRCAWVHNTYRAENVNLDLWLFTQSWKSCMTDVALIKRPFNQPFYRLSFHLFLLDYLKRAPASTAFVEILLKDYTGNTLYAQRNSSWVIHFNLCQRHYAPWLKFNKDAIAHEDILFRGELYAQVGIALFMGLSAANGFLQKHLPDVEWLKQEMAELYALSVQKNEGPQAQFLKACLALLNNQWAVVEQSIDAIYQNFPGANGLYTEIADAIQKRNLYQGLSLHEEKVLYCLEREWFVRKIVSPTLPSFYLAKNLFDKAKTALRALYEANPKASGLAGNAVWAATEQLFPALFKYKNTLKPIEEKIFSALQEVLQVDFDTQCANTQTYVSKALLFISVRNYGATEGVLSEAKQGNYESLPTRIAHLLALQNQTALAKTIIRQENIETLSAQNLLAWITSAAFIDEGPLWQKGLQYVSKYPLQLDQLSKGASNILRLTAFYALLGKEREWRSSQKWFRDTDPLYNYRKQCFGDAPVFQKVFLE